MRYVLYICIKQAYMKQLYWLLILCIFSIRCSNKQTDIVLHQADSLMVSKPDSAYTLLKLIAPDELRGSAQRAYYALLYTQAQYKNYDSIKSDSLIDIAVEHYQEHPNGDKLTRAYMFKGAALQDMAMSNDAMEWYKKAEETCDSTDFATLGYINIRIADLYRQSYIENDEHINRYKKALKYYKKTADTVKIDAMYSAIGQFYISKNLDSAKYYLDIANNIQYSEKNSDRKASHSLYLQMMYYLKKEYHQSIYYGQICIVNTTSIVNKKRSLSFLSRAYANIGNLDSAQFYYNTVAPVSNSLDMLSNYMSLEELEKCRGNYKLALEYNIKATDLGDSIRRDAQKHNLYQTEKQFDKHRVELKNKELKYQSDLRLLILIIGGLILVVLVVVIFIIISAYKRKVAQYSEFIDTMKNESIHSQNTLIEQLDRHNKTEQALKLVLENRLKTLQELIELSYRYGSSPNSQFKNKFNAILNTANLDAGALKDLKEIVNAKNFGLIDHLIEKHTNLIDKDINLICLVCCRFSAIEMSVFFNYSNQKTIYSSKSRLCEKLNISTSLEDYLDSEIEHLRIRY